MRTPRYVDYYNYEIPNHPKKIFLTDYNTVRGNDFKEMSDTNFLRLLKKNIKNGGEFYLSADKRFLMDLDNERYQLVLDDTLMGNFDKGFYTNFTKGLKDLITEREKRDEKARLLKTARSQISNGEEIDKDALPIYLSEKKKDLKFSFSDIKNYFHNIGEDISDSIDDASKLLNYHIWPFSEFHWGDIGVFAFGCSFVAAIISTGIVVNLNSFWYFLITLAPATIIYSIPALAYIGFHIKNRVSRLINFVNRRKFAKQEIKALTLEHPEIVYLQDEDIIEDNEVIENNVADKDKKKVPESLKISRLILSELESVTNKVRKITNKREQAKYGRKLQELLDEFNNRVAQFEEASKNGDYTMDGYQMLKLNMLPRINIVSMEIDTILDRETVIDEREQMVLEIQKSLQEFNNIFEEKEQEGRKK